MSPRFILWFGDRKRERERERESEMKLFGKKRHSYESTQVINIYFFFLEVNFLQKKSENLHEKGLKSITLLLSS